MKKNLLFILVTLALYSHAQYNLVYQTDFRDWTPGQDQGWIIINNDSLPPAGLLTRSVTAGVPVASLEMIDNELGFAGQTNWLYTPNNAFGQCDKIFISPPLSLGSDPYTTFYTLYQVGSTFDLYVMTNPDDTSLIGLTTNILSCQYNGFNVASLATWANTTIRLAFRLRGFNIYGLLDNVNVLNKTGLAYVPDSCFRTYLKTLVPNAFVGDSLDYLNLSVLNASQMVNPNGCIRSLEGIQYFPDLENIDFSNNLISYCPPVTFHYLNSMKVPDNRMTYIPDMLFATVVDFSHNSVKLIPNIFNQYADTLFAQNNCIWDCLAGTNRFVEGNLSYSPGVNFGDFEYYYMTRTDVGSGPQICEGASGDVTGLVYYDVNQNGIYDSGDFVLTSQQMNFYQSDFVYTDSTGYYGFEADTGAINLSVTDLPPYFTCTNTYAGYLGQYSVIDTNFRVIATTQAVDLGVWVNAVNIPNSGGGMGITLTANNYGTSPQTGVVKIYLPNGYSNINPEFGRVVNDTLVWMVTLNPFQTINNQVWFLANFPNADTLWLKASITCPGDVNLSNNTDSCFVIVGAPHDPNGKTVRTPQVAPGYSDYLYYTINFENTGTANATRVVISDYLSHQFDFSTFQLIGATQSCSLTWGHDSLPQFTLYPLTLTPNSVDSIHSRGAVYFRVKPLNPIVSGENIGNMASIYFDEVAPVNSPVCLVWAGAIHAAFTYGAQCGTHATSFTDVSPGTPLIRQWLFQGGTPDTSTGANPQITYDSSGTYQVTLIISTADYTDTLVQSVNIILSPTPADTVIASGSASICTGDSVMLTAAADTGYTYNWSTGQTTQTITANQYNFYEVTITNQLGCTALGYAEVEVNNATPIITDTSSCQSTSAYLSVATGFATYSWSNGDTTNFINVSQYGAYSVRVTDASGCAGVDTFNYAYHTNPVPVIVGDTTNCSGEYVILQTTQSYTSYMWSLYSSTDAGIYVSNPGTYSVTVTDSNGCVGSASVYHDVLPEAYTTITGDIIICKGQTAVLHADTGYAWYYWNTGDTTRSIAVTSGGTYWVTVVNSSGCPASNSYYLTERDKYNLQVIATVSGNCPGAPIQLTAQYDPGPLTDSSSGCTSQTATIGTGTTLEYYYGLLSAAYNSTRGQILFRASELQTALGGPNLINQLALDIGTFGSNAALENFTIKMGYTTDTSLDFTAEQDIDQVYFSSDFTPASGWNTFVLNTPLYWDGTSNLVIDLCSYNPNASGNMPNYLYCSPSGFYSCAKIGTDTDLCGSESNGDITSVRPNVRFNYCTPLDTPTPIINPVFDWSSEGGTAVIANKFVANTTATADSVVTFILMMTDTFGCKDEDSVTVNGGGSNRVSITASNDYLCHGDSAEVCVVASGGGSISWNTGDTSTCIIVNTVGNYTVTVNQGAGCIINDSLTIFNPSTDSTVLTASKTSICPDDTDLICVTPGIGNYIWSNGATTACITISQGGTYTVTVQDTHGCTSQDSVAIQVFTTTPVNVTAVETSFCPYDSTQICATTGFGSYAWSNGNTTACITVNQSGNYGVTAQDVNGCTSNNSQAIIVFTTTPVNISGETSFCPYDSTQICATAGIDSYAWSNGSTTACITVRQEGTYGVTAQDANGCISNDTLAIQVFTINPVTLTASKTVICPGDSVSICAPGGLNNYQWNTNGTSQCVTTLTAGQFAVTATDANGCTAVSEQLSITASPVPVITVSDKVLSTTNAGTYQWYLNDSAIIGAVSDIYTAQITGNYNVQVGDTNGCTGLSNTLYVMVNGIDNLQNFMGLKVYPNPFAGIVTAEFSSQYPGPVSFIITDMLGRQLYAAEDKSDQAKITRVIDLSVLANGVYILTVIADGRKMVERIVKQTP